MKYTSEQLENMSDDNISDSIVEKFGIKRFFDYLDWEDIMPLAVEHKIGGHYGTQAPEIYFAHSRFKEVIATDKSPQRAIACCLLMMEIDK